MVQRKKDEKEKTKLNIKASTGAWWKSTTTETTDENQQKQSRGRQSSPRKKQRLPRKTTPQKSSRLKTPKKSEKLLKEEIAQGETAAAETESFGKQEPTPREKTVSAKKSDKRRSGKTEKPFMADEGAKQPESGEITDADPTVLNKDVPKQKGAATEVDSNGEKGPAPKRKPRKGRPRKSTAAKSVQKPVEALPPEETSATQADVEGDEKVEKDSEEVDVVKSSDENLDRDKAIEEQKKSDEEDVKGDKEPEVDTGEKDAGISETEDTEKENVEAKKVYKLLINAEEPEECRLALLEDGRLESINVSTSSRTQRKNNIYKAKIVAIEPSLQAAFVDYGTEKNGFLPFSEIHPEYYKQELNDDIRKLVEAHQWKKLKISDVVERGQEILAQVVKEEVGKKGANMTTFLSIPGRHVVLMPGSDSAGISRKISGEQRRSQLRETMESLDLPEGIGWIVRTASVDITETALSRDVEYLLKLWEDIKERGQNLEGVGLVYEDHHAVLRFLRENFDPSIQEILVDDKTALEQVKSFISMLPRVQQDVKVRLHQGARPIFNQFSIEDQIESIYQPQVNLPSGGSIVIDPTEALVAIDVNSGSTSKGKNFEASIFQANLEAASELARQLRLRDLGGLIVVDFIDMRSKKHVIAVEKQVKAAMKKDKAKVDFTRISKFGLMQISRQKLGAPIEAGNYRRCEHCKGRGTVRSVETLSLFYMRRIQTGASRKPVEKIECHFPLDVAAYLLNKKRTELSEMESRYKVEITIIAQATMKPAENEIIFHKIEKEKNTKKQA